LTELDWILIAAVLLCLGALAWQNRLQRAVTAAFSVKAMEALRLESEKARAECEKARAECEKARAASEASAADSGRSRASIGEQLRVSELYARLSHRPWLFVNPVDIEVRGLTNSQNPSLLYFCVENGGQSPAMDVRLYFNCTQAMAFKFDPDSVPADRETKVMIGPGGKLRATVKFEPENAVAVANYYFFGYAKYTDVFQQEHQTLWCYRYNPVRSLFEPQKQFNSIE